MVNPSNQPSYSITEISSPLRTDNLAIRIEEGLTSVPKQFPSILLWDEQGHQLFEAITTSKDYYGTTADKEIMADNLDGICDMIGDDGILIELGSGCLPTSSMILHELSARGTRTTYYAHDICKEQLQKSLDSLSHSLSGLQSRSLIEIHGIVGSYEDSISWIQSQTIFSSRRVVLLWLGNCLAGISDSGFSTLIHDLSMALLHTNPSFCRLLVAVDGCKDKDKVAHAYDAPDGTSAAFVSNALVHANRVLGVHAFREKEWKAVHLYHAEEKKSAWGFCAQSSMTVHVGKSTIQVDSGEIVEIIQSRKRDLVEVTSCISGTSTEIASVWTNRSVPWAWYVLDFKSGLRA